MLCFILKGEGNGSKFSKAPGGWGRLVSVVNVSSMMAVYDTRQYVPNRRWGAGFPTSGLGFCCEGGKRVRLISTPFSLATCVPQEAAEFKFTTNIIRWRYKRDSLGRLELGEDGLPLRETNTRLVKWSDGSTQLLVGDESFDVGEHPIDR